MGILRKLCVVLIGASIAAGIALAFAGRHTLRCSPPPFPPRSEAIPAAGRLGPGRAAASQPGGQAALHQARAGYPPRPMARSVPLSLAIPAIRVRAKIIALGLRPDGSPAVPLLTTPFVTSWYDPGPTPGAPGGGGEFDRRTGQYLGNVVVFAEYVGQRR